SNLVLGILAELKPVINESHGKYIEQQARLAKRREEIKKAEPGPPATFKVEQEKWKTQEKEGRSPTRDRKRASVSKEEREEPWDLLKQMEGIKFVGGRPQVQHVASVPRTRMEFKYPTVQQQQQQPQQLRQYDSINAQQPAPSTSPS